MNAPDIDMLLKLSDIYGTDLEGVLYGQSKAHKALGNIRLMAVITYAALTLLTVISSAFLWLANRFFPIEDGTVLSEEIKAVFDARKKLTGARETTDQIILTIAFLGFLLLTILLATGNSKIRAKSMFIYILVLAASLLIPAAVFGMTDHVFSLVDYMITPISVIARMVVFFVITLVIGFVQKKKASHVAYK